MPLFYNSQYMSLPQFIKNLQIALEDKKAENITILNVHDLTSVCDYMIIVEGNSTQHVRALTEQALDSAKKQNIEVLGTEGTENREWVIVDLGNTLVHIMLPGTRTYYELEKLWDNQEEG